MALFMLCHEETINRISNWSIVSEVPSQSHHVFLRCPLWYTVAVNQHWHYTYPILIPWQPVFVVQDLPENCQSNFHREAWRSTRMARRSTVLIRRWSVRSYQPYHFLLNVSSARNPAEPRLRSLHTNQCVCTVSFEELNKTTQETFIFIPFHADIVGRQEGHPTCKKAERCFVGGDDLTGALHVLRLQLSTPPLSYLALIKSRRETFWYRLT